MSPILSREGWIPSQRFCLPQTPSHTFPASISWSWEPRAVCRGRALPPHRAPALRRLCRVLAFNPELSQGHGGSGGCTGPGTRCHGVCVPFPTLLFLPPHDLVWEAHFSPLSTLRSAEKIRVVFSGKLAAMDSAGRVGRGTGNRSDTLGPELKASPALLGLSFLPGSWRPGLDTSGALGCGLQESYIPSEPGQGHLSQDLATGHILPSLPLPETSPRSHDRKRETSRR